MPVHKVKGGYKWGEHGHVYPSEAGAQRQARAAYAHGYQGKSFEESDRESKMTNSYANSLVDLAAEVSRFVAKAQGRRGGPEHDPTALTRQKTKQEYFAVKETDSGERSPLPKERQYLREGEEAPPSVFVQEGPRGGRFFEVPTRGKAAQEAGAKRGAGSMAVVAEQPSSNPTREVKPTPRTSQTVDVEEPFESTIARIREILSAAKIPQARKLADGRSTAGYEISARDDCFEVYGRGRSDGEAEKATRLVERALGASDLDVTAEDDHVIVEAMKSDPMADLFGDQEIDIEVDPLLSQKSYSHDEAILVSGLLAKGVFPAAVVAAVSSRRAAG